MGRNTLIICLLLLIIAGIAGCGPSGLVRKAVQFEEAGLYKDAAETYLRLFERNSANPEARMGLQRAGQMYLEQQADKVRQHHSNGDYRAAVYAHTEATEFYQKLKGLGITLLPSASAEPLFADAMENYLSDLYTRGQQLIVNNRHAEAMPLFVEISKFNPDYRDTRSYLEQATFEPMFQEGLRLYNEGEYMQAYRKWKRIADRNPDYRQVTVNMNQALNERYKQGAVLLSEENFTQAALALREVFLADRNFRDVQQLLTQAINEPVYRRGVALLNSRQCRLAYFTFKGLTDDLVYRDSDVLLQSALECAQFPVAVATVHIPSDQQRASQFQSVLIRQLIKPNDPFLQVFELSLINPRADRAIASSQGNIQQAALKTLAESHEIKAVLQIKIGRFDVHSGKPQIFDRIGVARKPLPQIDGMPSFSDTLVEYVEVYQQNVVRINVEYRLVSTTDARILLANQFSEELSSTMHYVEYQGEHPLLFPAIETDDGFIADRNNFNSLQQLQRGKRSIRSTAHLTGDLFSAVTARIASHVVPFNPEQ